MKARTLVAVIFGLLGLGACTAVPTLAPSALNSLPPGGTARFLYPSAGGNAEAYLVKPRGPGRFPLMVLLHGHSWSGAGARRVLPAAELFASEVCYASLAISLPGYGDTESTAGPLADATRMVVLDAIASAKQLPWIDPERVYLYGFSRGAVVAAALVNQIDGLQGAVLHSGAYDLARLYRESTNSWLRRLLNPRDEAQPKLHNLLAEVADWRTATLVLHGLKDTLIPPTQALSLRDRLQSLGKPHRLVLFPDHGHLLPVNQIKDQALLFLRENGGDACAVNGR